MRSDPQLRKALLAFVRAIAESDAVKDHNRTVQELSRESCHDEHQSSVLQPVFERSAVTDQHS
jgi:hypothetical protein